MGTYDESLSSMGDYLAKITDPRSANLFLVSQGYQTLIVIAWYLTMVKLVLPAYMKNRPAYSLSSVMVYYNIFQIVLSAYLFYLSFIASGYGRRYNPLRCRELDQSTTDPDSIAALQAVHYYFLSKFTEFLDTFFFVLRKKDNQISFLHLYHHATMPMLAHIGVRFMPGGSTLIATGTNASVHVVMYTYYLLSGLGPKWQKYIWWKKYLTTMQMIQFGYFLMTACLIYLTRKECPVFCQRYPFVILSIIYFCVLLIMFSRFYMNNYSKKKL